MAKEYGKLAKMTARQGNRPKAIAQFKEALKFDPELPQLHRDLGMILAEEGRIKEAIDSLQTALKLDPKDKAVRKKLDELLPLLKNK